MEDMLKPNNKEYMRMAMLKHEETFKEQVYELHRLYRIQKKLMKNIASNNRPSNGRSQLLSNKNTQIKLDLEQPDGDLEIIDETEIELTLGPSTYNRRNKTNTPLTSDSGLGFSSPSMGSSRIKRTSSLTTPTTSSAVLQGSKSSFDVEEQMRQERPQQAPPWLFQCRDQSKKASLA